MSNTIHPQARTTPEIRQEIKDSGLSEREAAKVFNITRATAAKWLKRDDVQDRSHRAHTLHTTLSAGQEAIVLSLRQTLYLPLDDLLYITRQYINADVSRSGLARLLKREGMARLEDVIPTVEGEKIQVKKTFKDYEPGFVHIDIKYLPQMPDETSRRYLFVAIDRATRWVFLHIYHDMSDTSSIDFLRRLKDASHQNQQDPDRQWLAVHGPIHQQRQATQRPACLRQSLCRHGHRAPPGAALSSTNQRHGRALQWPYQRTSSANPLRQPGRLGEDAAQLPQAVQPSHTAARYRFKNSDPGAQRMATAKARSICKTGL